MMHPARALLAVALLAACGAEPSADAGRSARDSATASADARPGGSAPGQAASPVVLAPDGLEVAASGAGRTRLAFGAAQEGVLSAVGAVLGEPRERGTQEECPAGPLGYALYDAALQLTFQDGAFVGWNARQGSTLRTASGIGSGSTLRQVRAAYPAVTVQETSLGTEFAAGDLYGVVSDSSAAGVVEVVFGGVNCIFR